MRKLHLTVAHHALDAVLPVDRPTEDLRGDDELGAVWRPGEQRPAAMARKAHVALLGGGMCDTAGPETDCHE